MAISHRMLEFLEDLPPEGLGWSEPGRGAFIKMANALQASGIPDGEVCDCLQEAFEGAVMASRTHG